jgi:hypothetical protein
VVILLNIVALLLVLAFLVAAMGWLHERAGRSSFFRRSPPDACPTCEGVGARPGVGRLHPCPDCDGTGVRVSSGR